MPGLLQNRHVIAVIIFLLAFLIFKSSRLHPINDSKYSMMVSQCLLDHHSFRLDHYAVPRLPPLARGDYVQNGDIYQIEQVGPHLYYFFPPGSSVLSTPFVLLANAFGISTVKPDNSFNLAGETKIESLLAAFLMAVLTAIFFYLAQLLLPLRYSLLVTLGGALGTQIWSTASRAMFTDTWAVLLLSLVIFSLLAHEAKKSRLRPVLLASLLAWAYLVYPSYAVHVLAISFYLLFVLNRRQVIAYVVTGFAWAAGLVIYSRHNFGQLLPNYFRPGRLLFGKFWTALPGNLISPSRGLLIFVPAVIFVLYLLLRFRRQLPHPRLVVLAMAAMVSQLIVISGFDHWWGGHSYGPRLMTAFVPWLVLLSILGLSALLETRAGAPAIGRFELVMTQAVGLVLLCAGIFIHARGAISPATSIWNSLPENVDLKPERIWDWRQPQFLAGLIPPPFPPNVPLLEKEINFTTRDADQYLWYGWSIAEPESRWTNATHATMIFSLNEIRPLTLKIRMAPFLAPGKLDEQRVTFKLNEQTLTTVTLKNSELSDYVLSLPANSLRAKNILDFQVLGAATPASLGVGPDQRQLGLRVATVAVE
ncbi:MAG: putative rane protein [Acidobacteria bacterium]|nr:putative rane protein [Acidobacteriota bacterium]